MAEFLVMAGTAFWLGIQTAISPCPMATNIAAISYIGRRVGNAEQVLVSGLLYTLGRTAAYLALAVILVGGTLSIPQVSLFLGKYMHLALGPILILVSMFLLGLIRINVGGMGISAGLQKRIDAMGIWGAFPLGVLFALAFCPLSAALFFSVIPLCLSANSIVTLPVLYGVGTGLPVLGFAVLIATSVQAVGRAFNILSKIEWWARMATGVVFLAVGFFFCLRYIFEVI